jgi:hypothetical protein
MYVDRICSDSDKTFRSDFFFFFFFFLLLLLAAAITEADEIVSFVLVQSVSFTFKNIPDWASDRFQIEQSRPAIFKAMSAGSWISDSADLGRTQLRLYAASPKLGLTDAEVFEHVVSHNEPGMKNFVLPVRSRNTDYPPSVRHLESLLAIYLIAYITGLRTIRPRARNRFDRRDLLPRSATMTSRRNYFGLPSAQTFCGLLIVRSKIFGDVACFLS